jgi:hypothetical protein
VLAVKEQHSGVEMNWLEHYSKAIQSLAAIITAAVAVLALVGVKLQVDASYRVQREQSAKEIYRELLNLSISNPDYAAPDYCALKQSPKFAGYESYVDYVLYTAEQVIDMDAGWSSTMEQHLREHAGYLCSAETIDENGPAVDALLQSFRTNNCKAATAC